MRALHIIVPLLLAVGYVVEADYVIVESSLEYTDVSDPYALSVYRDIRTVIFGYLADGASENQFYRDYGVGFIDEHASKLRDNMEPLVLMCRMSRRENELLLAVFLSNLQTEQSLFIYDSSTSFFQPEEAIALFAHTFPTSFRGRLNADFTYIAPQSGFTALMLNGITLGNVRYYDSSGSFGQPDLEFDLERTKDLSPEVRRAFERYTRIRNAETVTFYTAASLTGAMFLGGVVTMAIVGESDFIPYETVFYSILMVPAVTTIVVGIELLFRPPKRLVSILNEWCCDN